MACHERKYMKQEVNRDFIGKYDQHVGIFENNIPHGLVDAMVNWFEMMAEDGWLKRSVFQPNANSLRDDSKLSVPFDFNASAYAKHIPKELFTDYSFHMNKAVEDYCFRYGITNAMVNYEYKMHRVQKAQGFHVYHSERSKYQSASRLLVYMTYLKCPDEGGETEFLEQCLRIKPEKGTTLIWPPAFTHMHRGNTVLKGEKIYITGWWDMLPERQENL